MIISRQPGRSVTYGGVTMKIVRPVGHDHLMIKAPNGEFFEVDISALEEEAKGRDPIKVEIDEIRASKVPQYHQAFEHLLKGPRTRKSVAAAGKLVGKGVTAAYAALARYDLEKTTAVLPPPTKPGGRGKTRVQESAEKIIRQTIAELIYQRSPATDYDFIAEAQRRLRKAGHKVSDSTLRDRLAKLPSHKKIVTQRGHTEASKTQDPIRDNHPQADKPLQYVQVDHWKVDLEVLDDNRQTIIGRAWLTLGIDLYDRMIYGMHVSLDAPSFSTFGQMMVNGMTRKELTAERLGIQIDSRKSGAVDVIGLDNAGEFTGSSAQASCAHFGTALKIRPLGKPQYGGHIERLNRWLADKFKSIPGATGSNPSERKRMGPGKEPVLTLEDLTRLAWNMVNQYHNEVNTGIGMTPIEKNNSYYFHPDGRQKRTLPDVFVDDLDLRRMWFPLVERTVQRYGFRINHLEYYSENIEYLVKDRKDYGKLQIRCDPLDVRFIYVLHPVQNEWMTVTIRKMNFPIASIYEVQTARKTALKRRREPTAQCIAELIDERRKLIEDATKKTRTVAREISRNASHKRTRQERPQAQRPATTVPHGGITILPSDPKGGASPAGRPSPSKPVAPSFHHDVAAVVARYTEADVDALFDD